MYLYFYFFFLPAALIESFNGDAESVSDVPPSTRHSASLSLPLILQPGISEPPQPLLPASAPSAPLPAPSLGTGSQQAAFGNPPALLQPPEVPVAHSTQFAANHQEFLPHLQAPQPIVPGLSVVAGALASAAAVASAMAAPPQPQSTTEPLPAMVQTLPLDANSVLTSNPTITITPTPSAAILQPSLVMGEQNLQWLLNGATSTPQAQEQIVSMRWKGTQWAKCMGGWHVQRPLRQKRKTAVISTPKHIILPVVCPIIKQRKSRDVVVNTYNRGPEKQFSDLPRYFSCGLILSALTGEPENVLQGRVQPRLRDWWDLIRWKQTTVAKSEVICAPRIHRRAIFYPSVWSQWLRTWCGCSAEYILRACCIPDTT